MYQPGDLEYGIKSMEEIVEIVKECPKCKTKLSSSPIIEPAQGLYAGSETILYRGMSKVFNMWSQVARTVILAHIKKEGRDRKNSGSYISHLGSKQKPISGIMQRFLTEIREINRFDEINLKIVDALEKIILSDDRPHDGLIGKLVEHSGLSRAAVTTFLRLIKLRSFELTDSLLNRGISEPKIVDNRKTPNMDSEEE